MKISSLIQPETNPLKNNSRENKRAISLQHATRVYSHPLSKQVKFLGASLLTGDLVSSTSKISCGLSRTLSSEHRFLYKSKYCQLSYDSAPLLFRSIKHAAFLVKCINFFSGNLRNNRCRHTLSLYPKDGLYHSN